MNAFPHPIEAGNRGDGSPLTLGDPKQLGDLFVYSSGSGYLLVSVFDLDGNGRNQLVGSSAAIFSFNVCAGLPDGTPIVDCGQRWGETSRAPHRDSDPEGDSGLCGSILTKGDFDGDGYVEALVAPQSIGSGPLMAISPKNGTPTHRSKGEPVHFEGKELKRRHQKLAAVDWDGDGRLDLIAIFNNENEYEPIDPATRKVPEDIRDRYTSDGRWKGKISGWALHLLRNTGTSGRHEFTYAGPVALPDGPGPFRDASGSLCAVNPNDASKGLLLIGYYGDVWHLPLVESPDTLGRQS